MQRLEERVHEFWKCSRAWKRDPLFVEGQTFQTLINRLNPLYTQGEFHGLRNQAESLKTLMVKGKIRRKKGEIKSKVIKANFRKTTQTQINGQVTNTDTDNASVCVRTRTTNVA